MDLRRGRSEAGEEDGTRVRSASVASHPRVDRPGVVGARSACFAVAVSLLAWGDAGAHVEDPPGLEPALAHSLEQIEQAFRGGDSNALRPLLPQESKVLVGLESFARPRGSYSRDQVVRMLRQIFEASLSTRFQFDRGRGDLSRGSIYYVPAAWSLRGSGPVQQCRLQFMLRKEGPTFVIREMKEVR